MSEHNIYLPGWFAKVCGVPLLLFLAVPLNLMAYGMISFRFFSERRFDTVIAGGAFDQGGLVKLAILILVMEVVAALGYILSMSIIRPRWLRIACVIAFFAAFAVPVGATLLYSWELARYIAVMGTTPLRIVGVRFAIGFLFVPLICFTGCFAGVKSIRRIALLTMACMLMAYAAFMSVDAAARKSISRHPRPTRCLPNIDAYVPNVPETSPDYGLKEILLGVPEKARK